MSKIDEIERLTTAVDEAETRAKQNHDSFVALEQAFIEQGVELRAERDQWKALAAQAQRERDAALMELDQHRQAVEDGRWVELTEWPIPVNKQVGRYRIVGAESKAKTITLEDCGTSEAALLKEGTE